VSARVLDQLTSEEFAVSVGFLSTASALRRFLARSKEVADIRDALRQGAITEETLRRFVSSLLQEFRPGERFQHELAVAALAVALEQRGTDFAEEFLRDLSRLQRNEMGLCTLLARECLKQRTSLTKDRGKVFVLGHDDQIPFSVGSAVWGVCGTAAGPARGSLLLR